MKEVDESIQESNLKIYEQNQEYNNKSVDESLCTDRSSCSNETDQYYEGICKRGNKNRVIVSIKNFTEFSEKI